ncbi:MAG: UTP--glucose-1-phosphate uridylyltransferase [candidate division KSB1 bacterium]|nr:UTP--glucose-1-phosphate uridylyltransferase [candidate division KSB1 bacterium]
MMNRPQPTGLEISFEQRFQPYLEKFRRIGADETIVRNFRSNFARFLAGEVDWLPEDSLQPLDSLPDAETIDTETVRLGAEHIAETVIVKLNGGLGTGMGLDRAKSLLIAKDGHTFLEIILAQVRSLGLPLVLMNSFVTHRETLAALAAQKPANPVLAFEQNRVPKINAADAMPASCPEREELEWCPPGHGDFYIAFASSGILRRLLEQGYKYAFISNADNLGAVLHAGILGYFIRNELDFLMETAERTPADRKGGHLALKNGKLVLREIAQCPEADLAHFRDIRRHRFFNTNNLWLNLKSLQTQLEKNDYLFTLPLIANRKNLDPRDPSTPEVIQLETAMGAAVSVFPRAQAIRVPRSRFIPVKDTNDLLIVRSDYYQLLENYTLVTHPQRRYPEIRAALDPRFYKFYYDFEKRFPEGVPSLRNCRQLTVEGDVYWQADVSVEDDATVVNRSGLAQTVPRGSVIRGELSWN